MTNNQPSSASELRPPTDSEKPLRKYWWVELLVALTCLAAVASVAGGIYEASRPRRSGAWIATGIVTAIAWLALAAILALLRDIAAKESSH